MSLNLDSKKEVVAEISARLAKAQAVVLAEYRGLPVEAITVLRARARKGGVYLKKVSVSSTMGVGIRIDQGSLGVDAAQAAH